MKKLVLISISLIFGVFAKSQDTFLPTPGDTIKSYSFKYNSNNEAFLFLPIVVSNSGFNWDYMDKRITEVGDGYVFEGFYSRLGTGGFESYEDTFSFTLDNLPVEKNIAFYYRAHDVHGPDNIKVDSLFLKVRFEDNNTATVLGVNAYEFADAKIFPNPVGETLFLDAVTNANIKIFEQNGKLVLNKVASNGRIEVAHLKSGLYYLQVGNENSLKKFVKK